MKQEKKNAIAVCVLAGGRSKRMGCEKHSVIIPGDGRTFLDRICDETDVVFPEHVSGRYLSVRGDQNIARDGFKIVTDRFGDTGPLGGIASVLMEAERDGFDAVLMIACDMTAYDHKEIIKICECYEGEDVLFARTDKAHIQPLASIYGVVAREAIQKQIEEGNYRIRDIAAIVNKTGYFDTEDPGNYINQNTPPH